MVSSLLNESEFVLVPTITPIRPRSRPAGGGGTGEERQQAIRAMRGQLWSLGRPSVARPENWQRFLRAIARRVSSEDAAAAAAFEWLR